MAVRYIVTGAAGHLGSTIICLLQGLDIEVFGLLRRGEAPVVEAENIHYAHGDVCQVETMEPLFAASPEQKLVVIHAAGLISIAGKISPTVREVNVSGTANVLTLAKHHGVDRFVYVSSVHAIPELPIGEVVREVERFSSDLVTGCYAKTKAEATQLVLDAAGRASPPWWCILPASSGLTTRGITILPSWSLTICGSNCPYASGAAMIL